MKGIYHRGYLPHWDFARSVQAITFRLADAVPAKVIKDWQDELVEVPDSKLREKELHRRIAKFEDAGCGMSVLKEAVVAGIVQRKLTDGHPDRYSLIEWCVMPNHLHVLIRLTGGEVLSEVVKSWKGGSAVEINRLLKRKGPLWQRDYYDRFIRDMDHFYAAAAYIRNNPVKAGLCDTPQDWQFSSAGVNWKGAPASAGLNAKDAD